MPFGKQHEIYSVTITVQHNKNVDVENFYYQLHTDDDLLKLI